ncbi:MAG: YjbH domain-containing protein [Pseudomonadota bacterium]
MIRTFGLSAVLSGALLSAVAMPALAEEDPLTTTITNSFGTPGGLIDMPTAEMAPDGQLSVNISHFDGYTRSTATFQLTPWLSGSFRYVGIDNLSPAFNIYYDRSFDVKLRLIKETDYLPGVAIGLQDFLGTGIYSGEYIVATKEFGNRLRVTGGLGWGRLGSYNSIGSAGSRQAFSFANGGTGGNFRFSDYFSGDMALFAGVSYDITDKFSLSAEYSSDNYDFEQAQGVVRRRTPWNVAATYKANDNLILRLFSQYGDTVGVTANVTLNPKRPPLETRGPAPLPVSVRDQASLNDLGWTSQPGQEDALVASLKGFIEGENLDFIGARVSGRSAHVRVENTVFMSEAQALGRVMRIMSRVLPGSVEQFHVTVERNGIPLMTTTMARSDLERLEFEREGQALAAAQFTDSVRFGNLPEVETEQYPDFTWSIGPTLRFSAFDPSNPFRVDLRAKAQAGLDMGRGWRAEGATSIRVIGNLDSSNRPSNSLLPRVRTTQANYFQNDGLTLDRLTLAKYARIAPNWYGRATIGYLELQYAGLSTEVLWKPVDSRLALGAEINYVQLRDSDVDFGFASHRTVSGTIPHVNGHLSAYYDFNGGYQANIHAGRYLAGDWGATLEVSREFNNGWVIGAFATQTNVSAARFGEGSFDKGLFFTVPFGWLLGTESKREYSQVLRPIQRDGGQRVNVTGRLYDTVSEPHRESVAESWGKFWK